MTHNKRCCIWSISSELFRKKCAQTHELMPDSCLKTKIRRNDLKDVVGWLLWVINPVDFLQVKHFVRLLTSNSLIRSKNDRWREKKKENLESCTHENTVSDPTPSRLLRQLKKLSIKGPRVNDSLKIFSKRWEVTQKYLEVALPHSFKFKKKKSLVGMFRCFSSQLVLTSICQFHFTSSVMLRHDHIFFWWGSSTAYCSYTGGNSH